MGALDAFTREQVQEILLHAWSASNKMVFFITHSVEEALFLGTRLIVMSPSPGRITHRYDDVPFSREFIAGEDARKVKSGTEFIRMREEILALIHHREPLMNKPNSPAKTADQPTKTSRFRELGEGSSLSISVITIAVLLLAWYGVTRLGWIKPLFLPPPQAVIQQFWEYATGIANDKPLLDHFLMSLFRVGAAFAAQS